MPDVICNFEHYINFVGKLKFWLERLSMVGTFIRLSFISSLQVSIMVPTYSLPPGKCFKLFCCLLFFFKINFFVTSFQEYHLSAKEVGSRHFVGPDLGPICLQRF